MNGTQHKIMPTRDARDQSLVVDLDDLIAKSVGFKFRGKQYKVKPVSTEKFMELSEKLADAGRLVTLAQAGEQIAEAQVYKAYQEFISVLVPNFTVDIFTEMELPQVHALLNLIIKHATGQPMNLDQILEKKKINLTPKY